MLERTDQPLAADQPLLREIRAAMVKAVETAGNHRRRTRVHARSARPSRAAAVAPEQVPDFYSAGFGFGSRDLQPGTSSLPSRTCCRTETRRRHYYLGIDFVRKARICPKLEIWQEQLLEAYPDLAERALVPAASINLLPTDADLAPHPLRGWLGRDHDGQERGITAHELVGMHVKANPKYGSEKKGQPTTFYGCCRRSRCG